MIFIAGAAAGVVLAIIVGKIISTTKSKTLKQDLERQIEGANREAENIIKSAQLEATAEAIKKREELSKEIDQAKAEIRQSQQRLSKHEDSLDRQNELLQEREKTLQQGQQSLKQKTLNLEAKEKQISSIIAQQKNQLLKITAMDTREAKQLLLQKLEDECEHEMNTIIQRKTEEITEIAEEKSREIISSAIQRYAAEQTCEVTVSTIDIPNDDMKGRIVGRNGRNIKAFEKAAGVDVIVDDNTEEVTISCFDSVRREIGRRAMTRLTLDGRIHPAHIEKIVKQETKAVDKIMAEAGEQAAYDAGISGLKPEILRMMGRLKFRTSYGQNQLAHAVESAKLASIIAAELGADIEIAKMGGFLHDIGKAMDHNQEGTHAQLGAEFCRRYGVRNKKVLNAIASHHHEADQISVEAVIVEAADAISGARPGARREDLDAYIKRIRALEDLAKSFKGVEQAFAIQAGREVRIIVRPDDIDDFTAGKLARDIAKQIEENMQYPGQIKVIVIRETRAIDYAK